MPPPRSRSLARNSPALKSIWRRLLGWGAATGLALSVCTDAEDGAKNSLSYEVEAGVGTVGRSDLNRGNLEVGRFWELDSHARVVLSLPVRDQFLLRIGADWQRYSYTQTGHSILPNTLESASLVLGMDVQLGQAWLARVEVQPGLYNNAENARFNGLKIPVVLGASYFVSADLQLVAGVSVDTTRKYPVLPAAGFRWKFAESWVLDAILPAPRLEFSASKALTLFAGADFREDTYRVDDQFGSSHGNPQLDDAVLDYLELRVGGGAAWKARPGTTLELEAGCVPVHQFDFYRANERLRATNTAPYVNFAIKGSF